MNKNNYWVTLQDMKETDFFVKDASMKEQFRFKEGILPVRYYDQHLYYVDWHWHEEVEFTQIVCDQMICEIGSEQLTLRKGDCLLINSQVLHQYVQVDTEQEGISDWTSLLFDPQLIADADSLAYRQYIEPIIRSSRQYLLLDPSVPWQKAVIEYFQKAEQLCVSNPPVVDLYLKQALTGLWIQLAEHMDLFPAYENRSPKQRKQERLRIMMRYIWEHYQEPITLTDIAREVHVSERTAERCFKDEIQVSPLIYLQNYRLRCARRMLLTDESSSILDIALNCGFESSSYFDRIFKRAYQITPRQFRQTAGSIN
ncbi:MAG: AraC family transcriptional regulator [Lachnospiraceae bacterium]|nr:AraC family transcriptional regulator [Lachnospiraceae bacterium]